MQSWRRWEGESVGGGGGGLALNRRPAMRVQGRRRKKVVDGLAIENELAAESSESEAPERCPPWPQESWQICYLNSVLQCLDLHPSPRQFLPQSTPFLPLKRYCPFCIQEKRIARSLRTDHAQDSPAKIQSCLRLYAEHFRNGHQGDAHEFLRYVIDACHCTSLRLRKLRQSQHAAVAEATASNTIVKEIFGGSLQSRVMCGAESNKVDEIMDISLDILHSSSLKDALHKLFEPEVLDGNNKYKCDKRCKKLVPARKQMSVFQAPNILVIQLQDAMGQWYYCNDSYVSATTLEEVLSHKFYILFYARKKQRLASSTSVPVANGVGASKKQPSDPPPRPTHGRILVESACKDPPALPMADKLTSSPRVKFSISGNIASKRVPAVTNGKMLLHENHLVEKSDNCKQTVQLKMNGKDLSSKVNTNGFHKENEIPLRVRQRKDVKHECYNLNKNSAGALDGMKTKSSGSLNGNGKARIVNLLSGQSDLQEGHGMVEKGLSNGSVYDFHESCNVGTNHELAMASTSGKMPDDSCILLAQDAESRAEVEKLKEVLKNVASTMLRSCGWSNEVYDFMRAKRRKCTENADNDALDINHLRKLFIAEARPTFISLIPESLKEELISRLRSFSKEMG